jgi:glutamate N-acetyltransferase / amino-acid N-acetyltransferase
MQGMGFERVLGGVCAPAGFLASGVACGIKGEGKLDLALVCSETDANVAGVFTTNEVKAAPVLLTAGRTAGGTCRAVVVNSGNANCMTGAQGEADALAMAAAAEKALNIAEGQALVASTGPIGNYLSMKNIEKGIAQAATELSLGGNSDAAKAIMTTDTYPKELALEMQLDGVTVRMGAMAKGSGMIHPKLATMISVITTDMPVPPDALRSYLSRACEWSFNRISVDGDQSTNDTVLMLANGAAFPEGHKMSKTQEDLFFRSLCWLMGNLAMSLVKDGEGASKLLRIVVNGARDEIEATAVTRAIGNSNLVKCAFYGSMPNWGRVAAAAGSAGVPLDPAKMDIFLGEHKVASLGEPSEYDSHALEMILKRDEVEITVELGLGKGSAYFLTSDLTTEYVEINAFEKS